MAKAKPKPPEKSYTEIRHTLPRYFYDRNRNATGVRGRRALRSKFVT
jgi:hypothetical protein